MAARVCPGLPADWPNAWLAALGAMVLADKDELRLSWTDDPIPFAVLHPRAGDPVETLAAAWPSADRFAAMPIAEHHAESISVMKRQVPLDVWHDRSRLARTHPDHWTLSSSVTDLAVKNDGNVGHAPFDPPGPGPVKWLHHRLVKTANHIKPDQLRVLIEATLDGVASRVEDNGLGFDGHRFAAGADRAVKRVDPVVEVLAFFGLALLPVRGDGPRHRRPRQRGWDTRPRTPVFRYPTWSQPLDRWGIDALLDACATSTPGARSLLGVSSEWATVSYRAKESEAATTGYLAAPARP